MTALTDRSLVPSSPDTYYGARPEQLEPQVRKQLRRFIQPTIEDDHPICPNFFLEAEGPDGSLAVVISQALYDGALGARGIHHLRTYGQDQPLYDNRASTITSIYYGGTLQIYTVHCGQPTDSNSQPTYIVNQLGVWALTGNKEKYAVGVTAYRALWAWAKQERDTAIDNANHVFRNLVSESTTPETSTTG